jgi:hypothetical protein
MNIWAHRARAPVMHLMVFGHGRIPIVGWMREKAAEALLQATEARDEVTAIGGAVSLTIGELVSAHTQAGTVESRLANWSWRFHPRRQARRT